MRSLVGEVHLVRRSSRSPYKFSRAGDCFPSLKEMCGTHVLVQMDSTTVMHYLNRMGGTRSRSLDLKVREIIQWCQPFRITLSAVHISGSDNVEADRLSRDQIPTSRCLEHSTEWSLDIRVTNQLFDLWAVPTVDLLFATRLNSRVVEFYSCLQDHPGSARQSPSGGLVQGSTVPLLPLLSLSLHKVIREEAQVIATLPWWPRRGWFPLVLQLLIDLPVLLSMTISFSVQMARITLTSANSA